MRSGLGLFALLACGCNQIFDLRETRSVDAAREYFDAPTDAPFACPPAGTTPAFSPFLHQVIQQDCNFYAAPADRDVGIAICVDEGLVGGVYEGARDMPMTELPGFVVPNYDLQRLGVAPEGDYLLALYYSTLSVNYSLRTFTRGSSGTWQLASTAPEALPSFIPFSAPTRPLPRRRMLRGTTTSSTLFREMELDASGTWQTIDSYTPTDLGVTAATEPKLSADGLRAMFTASGPSGGPYRLFYTDRPNLTARFRKAEILPGVPTVYDAYMTDDCSRVYFSGLQSVFYVQRL